MRYDWKITFGNPLLFVDNFSLLNISIDLLLLDLRQWIKIKDLFSSQSSLLLLVVAEEMKI